MLFNNFISQGFADVRTLFNMRGLLALMARREIVTRTAGSAGGLLWVWIPPLLTLAMYFLVFDIVFGLRASNAAGSSSAPRLGTFLIVGMLPWMAFADMCQRGMMSLIDAGGLLHKNPLPLILFPAKTVLACAFVFAPLVILLIPFYASSHNFSPAVWSVLLLFILQTVMAFLLAFLLAIFAAALRDVIQVIGILLSIGIFASPVLFSISMFPQNWQFLLWLNPMTGFILGYQSTLLNGASPDFHIWLCIFCWIGVLGFFLALALSRCRDTLVDWI